jgi:cysteinyl-tRNA synthetase
MALKIFNTLSGEKDEFVPLTPGRVRMYVCGVTVYDSAHLGHCRFLITFDVIYRYLRFLGFDVTYVRNFTDVDDKIIKAGQRRAGKLGNDHAALHRRISSRRCGAWLVRAERRTARHAAYR